jgi:Zn-dependent membrane protease YugP
MYLFSFSYWIFMLPALAFTMLAQMYVNSAYKKWSQRQNARGITGMEAVQRMVRVAGLSNIQTDTGGMRSLHVQQIGGQLTDHYDPRTKTLNLSPGVAQGNSVASIAVAAHELGHAQQDADNYFPLQLRIAFVPMVNIGSYLGWILILAGIFLQITNLAWIGLFVFSTGAIFALLTLPVELNASARARKMLTDSGLVVNDQEMQGVGNVLNAAALTYVAALATAVMQLLYFASLISGRRRR